MIEYTVQAGEGQIIIKDPIMSEIRRESYKIDLQYGPWFKQLRKARGLTQPQVVEGTGGCISNGFISNLENNNVSSLRVDQVIALSEIYNVERRDILCAWGYLTILEVGGWYYRYWNPAEIFKYENPGPVGAKRDENLGQIIKRYKKDMNGNEDLTIKKVADFMEEAQVKLEATHRLLTM